MTQPITISTLTSHIVQLFEEDDRLRDLWVTGEVSNWKRAASGHIYFSMKDSGATITAVMWRNSADSHTWLPNNGDQIIAHGYVGVYPERGVYQLYANRIQPAGRGQLYAQFEALKGRLAAAGLFAQERKRSLVRQPQRIGIVTSANAAALRDILNVLTARWPLIEVILFPALVQGVDAPAQLVQAVATANHYSQHVATIDTIVLARGGGSIEDLWAFNDEHLAHTIAQSAVPVVAGVGHETDFTIADFVADLRAPTPSAAAAAVVPDQQEVREQLFRLRSVLTDGALRRLVQVDRQLQDLRVRLRRTTPQRQLDQRRQRLDDYSNRLQRLFLQDLQNRRLQLETMRVHLRALSPHDVLQRGYSIIQQQDGTVVTDPATVAPGEQLRVQAAAGEYHVIRQ
ncbi:MAG: exodeoxyribonuclease VII large subunit [Caldilineaceae bacterium]|nr:exodeoxyribonuclease VII large subunit [Caldilineaceae bacterium]